MSACKVTCPRCGSVVKGVPSTYGDRYACCGLVGYRGKPLVTPSTLAARVAAHNVFDRLWRNRYMGRSIAYRWLAAQLEVEEPQAHMSVMDEETAIRTVEICLAELKRRGDDWAAGRSVASILIRPLAADPSVELGPVE